MPVTITIRAPDNLNVDKLQEFADTQKIIEIHSIWFNPAQTEEPKMVAIIPRCGFDIDMNAETQLSIELYSFMDDAEQEAKKLVVEDDYYTMQTDIQMLIDYVDYDLGNARQLTPEIRKHVDASKLRLQFALENGLTGYSGWDNH